MKTNSRFITLLALASVVIPAARGDEPEPATRRAIDEAYRADNLKADRLYIQRLAKLASSQKKEEAARTYEDLFEAALSRNLAPEAEAAADKVHAAGGVPVRVEFLADLVRVFGRVDRGALRESVDAVLAAARGGQGGAAALPAELRLSLVDAYFQKLVRAGQAALAVEAMDAIAKAANDPALRDLATNRRRQAALVGKPAPIIEGKDVDGRPVRLADSKGDVVLIVFWATWSLPDAQNLAFLEQVYQANRGKGLRVLGVDLDALQEGGPTAEAATPTVRRFLLDNNVPWPTIMDAPGERSIARLYDVIQVPANYLIGRDGAVVDLMLNRTNMEAAIAKALSR